MSSTDPTVLVLTQDFDPTVDPIVKRLDDKGARVVRVDLSYFPQNLTLTGSDFDGERRVLRHRDRTLDLDQLTSVWYRRPTAFDFGAMGEAEAQFARAEAQQGIGGLLRATDCLWVNRPDVDSVAELKPYHLRLARRLGMRTPRTLVTNDPAEVRSLLDAAGVPLVYKAFSGGVIHYSGGFPSGLLTTLVGPELEENLERVRHTMCMFQEYVEKDYEVRLTVIGNSYFPVVIRSQDADKTKVDWRGESHLPYGDYVPVPDDLVSHVRVLLAKLGLVYAALDFIVTPQGDWVFLEVNPAGQFMWMYHDLNIRFDEHMADLLMCGSAYDGGAVTQVGY